MRFSAHVLCIALTAISLLWTCPRGLAAEPDASLDALFAALQTKTDMAGIESLERQIWVIWNDSGRADVNGAMAEARQTLSTQGLTMGIAVYDRVIEMAPDFAEGWNRRATMHYMSGNYDASMRDIEQTLALEPRHYGAIFGKGLIYSERGEYEAAREAFADVRRVHPHAKGVKEALDRLQKLEAN